MHAVVDIGSNSIKYLFATRERGALTPLETGSWITRLGKNLETNGGFLEDDSLKATASALAEISHKIRASRKIEGLRVVATAAARNAKNSDVLSSQVKKHLGVELEIFTGQQEALWSMKGAQQAAIQYFPGARFVYLDVGGASTEVGFLLPEFKAHSFDGGALRCHQGLGLDKTPVPDSTWNDARIDIQRYFPESSYKELLSHYTPQSYRAVAVGGTLLMATRYCQPLVQSPQGCLVTRLDLEQLADRIRRKSLRSRQAMPDMISDRADILPAGILVLTTCLARLGQDEVFVTSWGLRHGLSGTP
jgi:exopolyphosphatase / guanosine-5'-triphosphate,3'-diphosphate pyrophosphatase